MVFMWIAITLFSTIVSYGVVKNLPVPKVSQDNDMWVHLTTAKNNSKLNTETITTRDGRPKGGGEAGSNAGGDAGGNDKGGDGRRRSGKKVKSSNNKLFRGRDRTSAFRIPKYQASLPTRNYPTVQEIKNVDYIGV